MIRILDEILLDPEHIPPLLTLLQQCYLPGAGARGLTLLHNWVSPPVAVPGQCNRLWLLWQVPDIWSYYAMRKGAGAPVLEFWAAVDELGQARYRHLLSDAQQPLPSLLEPHHET